MNALSRSDQLHHHSDLIRRIKKEARVQCHHKRHCPKPLYFLPQILYLRSIILNPLFQILYLRSIILNSLPQIHHLRSFISPSLLSCAAPVLNRSHAVFLLEQSVEVLNVLISGCLSHLLNLHIAVSKKSAGFVKADPLNILAKGHT